MLSIHMCEKMHIYFVVRILHSLRVCQIVHWVMGTTGKIPAAGSLLSKGRQYGMPNLAHMPLLFVYLPCCQLPGMSVCSVYPEKLGKENIYSKFLNGTVLPRVSHNNIRDKLVQGCNLVLMWTTHGILSMPGMNENFQPNHFVPLVVFVDNDNDQKKNKQQKITDMFKAKSVKQESNQILYLNVCILTTTTTITTTTQQQQQYTLKLQYDFLSICML